MLHPVILLIVTRVCVVVIFIALDKIFFYPFVNQWTIPLSLIQLSWNGPLYVLRDHKLWFKKKKFFSVKIDFVLANSADPDEMLHSVALHLGLLCSWYYDNYCICFNPLLHTSAFGRLWNVRFWKIWKMEHLLLRSKCSIFHNIFKTIEMYKLFFGKYLKIWIIQAQPIFDRHLISTT